MKEFLTLKNVGYALIVYSVVFFLLGQAGLAKELNGNWYGQIMGCVIGGFCCLLAGQNSGVTKTINDVVTNVTEVVAKPTVKPDVKKEENQSDEHIDKLTQDQLIDLESINHLTQRLSDANDADGVKLCRELQMKIFDLHHKKTEKIPEKEQVTDAKA